MDDTMKRLLEGKENNYLMPFFWQHGEEEPVLREYMRVIQAASCQAVCVESRPHPDFCGPGWWHDMDIILDEARARGMQVWILDDSHFPTGYANGAMREKPEALCRQSIYRHQSHLYGEAKTVRLPLKKLRRLPKVKKSSLAKLAGLADKGGRVYEDDSILSIVATSENGRILDLSPSVQGGILVWDKPQGNWCVTLCGLSRNLGAHREYINMMDSKSCRVLIDAVYEAHWARYREDFGTTIAGFFSDEPELGNGTLYMQGNTLGTEQDLPWSAPLEQALAKAWGAGWKLKLPLLWQAGPKAAPVRTVYMDLVTRLVKESFSEQIGSWCRQHGVEYIGHVVEDNGQHCRTASSLGHYFRGLAGQDMAGIDVISNQVVPQGEDEPTQGSLLTPPRDGTFYHYGLGALAASAAAIEPRKQGRSVCEIFGNYGWGCGVKMQKYIADHFLVQGINHFVPHAFSPKPYPDTDCPPHFYARGNNPQIRHFGALMRYMNRVCECTSGGRHIADVAILYHGESEWAGEAMPFEKPLRRLWDRQINCDVLPADVFAEPSAYNTVLQNPLAVNTQRYKAIIVPKVQFVPEAFAHAAAILLQKGLPVFFVEALPQGLCETGEPLPPSLLQCPVVSLEDLAQMCEEYAEMRLTPTNERLRVLHYEAETHRYFIVNEGQTAYNGTLFVPTSGPCYAYEAWSNKIKAINTSQKGCGTDIHFALEPSHSLMVVFDEASVENVPVTASGEKILLQSWKRSISHAVDYPSFHDEKQICLPDSLYEEKPKFSGFVRYETTFSIDTIGSCILQIEDAEEGVEVFINDVSLGVQIVAPFEYNLSKEVRQGENSLRIEVATNLEREAYSRMKGFWKLLSTRPTTKSGITTKVYLIK